MIPTLDKILKVMKDKGFVVFENPSGFDLNIVGIRTASIEANKFDDFICLFYKVENNWFFACFPATTDPGTFYRLNPINNEGTAILKPGQYRAAFKLGLHRGKYKALTQKNNMTVYRDSNKDNLLDTENVKEETGMFGINLHRANEKGLSINVDKYSAGCQVIQNDIHFNFIIEICERAKSFYSDSFTYTLLEEKDF